MMKHVVLSVLAIFGASTTAAIAAPQTRSGMPDPQEITAFVQANWDGAFELQAAYAVGRQGQRSTLVSVNAVACEPERNIIVCVFSPKTRFADGTVVEPTLETHVRRRPDGTLEEMIRIERTPS